jgi:hypothetical protein
MKKNLFLVVVLFVLVQSGIAQVYYEKPLKFGIGAVAGLPMSDAKSYYKMAYGFDVKGEYNIAPALELTFDGCFGAFTKESTTYPNKKLVYGLVGVKYYVQDIIWTELQGGVSLIASHKSTLYIVAPSIGVNISPDIDVSVKYQAQIEKGFNYSYIGLRLGFRILSINL